MESFVKSQWGKELSQSILIQSNQEQLSLNPPNEAKFRTFPRSDDLKLFLLSCKENQGVIFSGQCFPFTARIEWQTYRILKFLPKRESSFFD